MLKGITGRWGRSSGRGSLRMVVVVCALLSPVASANDMAGTVRSAFAEHARFLSEQALAYEHGEGVAQDPEHAAALYCEAARLGNVEAMVALGWMYANGRGVVRSDDLAGTLFGMAARHGDPYAERMLRFTGPGNERPACLQTPPQRFADAIWRLDERIAGLPSERRAIARLVVELAPEYQIRPTLALAIAITESALNPRAVSPKNAMGVMQLIPGTAARFNVRDVFDPADNIRGGLAYLRWLLAYFEGDTVLAAAAYNAGERAVERYGGVPPFRETQAYVKKIMEYVTDRHHPYDPGIASPSGRVAAMRLDTPRDAGS